MPDLSIEDMIQTIKNSGYAVAILVFLAVCILVYIYKIRYEVEGCVVYREDKKKDYVNILLVLGAAFLIKSVLAVKYAGHGTDMNCFYAWSDMIFDNGISKFYYLDAFTDYPPGYMAILWVIAGIRRLFGIGLTSDAGRWLIKLVPMLADLGTAYLVYLFSKKKFSEGTSLTGRPVCSESTGDPGFIYMGTDRQCVYSGSDPYMLSVHGKKDPGLFCVYCWGADQTPGDYVCTDFDLYDHRTGIS